MAPQTHIAFRTLLKCSAFGAGLSVALLPTIANANPAGGAVASGAASIGTAANATTIRQSSEGVVIDWSSFNVGKGQTTTFSQPNAQAIAVNRIGGTSASQIFGTIDANGRIVLINGNGILFGKGSQVDAGALVATSSDGSNSDVLSGKFTKAGSANASIVNDGKITASKSGLVALVASGVTNAGTINAKLGTVTLGGASKFTVDFAGDGLVSFAATGASPGRVTNTGKLSGGTITLTARSAEGLAAGVVNAGGTITAQAAHGHGGAIVLDAGNGGSIDISGRLDASGRLGGGSVLSNSSSANVTVDKSALLSADATQSGNGGSVRLVSENTQFAGTISAKGAGTNGKGGNADVSGANTLGFTGLADLTAANGNMGTLTLDPTDYFINSTGVSPEPGASAISVATLENELSLSSVQIKTKNGGGQAGNIEVQDSLTWSSPSTLLLKANASVLVDAGVNVTSTGSGSIQLYADRYGTGGGAVSIAGTVNIGGSGSASIYYDPANYDSAVNYSGAVTVASGNLNAFMLVNTLAELQSIGSDATTRSGEYALGRNIDATATAGWNAGQGFIPLGPTNEPFSGVLDGQNFSITNLTINQPGSDQIGLLGEIGSARVYNLSLSGNVTGFSYVGALGGLAAGTIIQNVTSTVNVTGFDDAGGLVGYLDGGTISASKTSGTLAGSAESEGSAGYQALGGLVGFNAGTIDSSSSSMSINVTKGNTLQIGGLVGWNTSSIEGSYATGNVIVNGGNEIGGLVGVNSGGNITTSYAEGNVTGATQVGGFAGGSYGSKIDETWSSGQVTGTGDDVGGFVGENSASSTILKSYETGNVIGTGASDVGGFVGLAAQSGSDAIETSYESGAVTGGYGFAGSDAGSRISDVFWDTTNNAGASGDPSSLPHIAGLTTTQFQAGLPGSFSASNWGSNPLINNGFPYLSAVPPG